jgi:hypothetical protein
LCFILLPKADKDQGQLGSAGTLLGHMNFYPNGGRKQQPGCEGYLKDEQTNNKDFSFDDDGEASFFCPFLSCLIALPIHHS